MKKRVVLIRHEDGPDDDRVVTFFRNHNINPEIVRPYQGESLGSIKNVVACAIYGGQFNVFEEAKYPFLLKENNWIEQCLQHNVPLIGICQGAQSIARVLGAEVGPKAEPVYEFGYYEIHPTETGTQYFPDSLVVAQSHFHEFQLPQSADLLASSQLYQQQAFRYGSNVFGFQFHPEVIPDGFRRWQQTKTHVYGQPGAQDQALQNQLMQAHDTTLHKWFMQFLKTLFNPAVQQLV